MVNNILKFWTSLETDDPMDPFFEAAPVLMHSIGADGTLLKVSRFWADKLGYAPEEMVGRRSTEFLTEASRAYAVNEVLPEFFRTGTIHNVEYDFVRKDGTALPVLMSAVGQYADDGTFSRSLAVMFDNSEGKRIQAQLRQHQRNDAIGSLAGGVAHDFNNLLAIIQGCLRFLATDPDRPNREELIRDAIEASERGASLTHQLLAYGRQAMLMPSELDLNATVRRSSTMIERLLPANVRLEAVTMAGLWTTHLDATQLQTALLNVINNARDAMPNGGKITIETSNVRVTDAYQEVRNGDLEPGRYVMLAVTDTGEGMDHHALARAFEPFYTTKPVGRGTGLGLSMVFGFARQSKGAVLAYSEKGVGTTIKMYFPATPAPSEETGRPGDGVMHRGEGRLVLLAEDEEGVRKIMAQQLESLGYSVRSCGTGDLAMGAIRDGLVPDLLLTDIVMPGSLQGPALAEKAREILPDLKVLFVSGYPAEAAVRGNGVRPEDRHLIKPVHPDDLAQALMALIGPARLEN